MARKNKIQHQAVSNSARRERVKNIMNVKSNETPVQNTIQTSSEQGNAMQDNVNLHSERVYTGSQEELFQKEAEVNEKLMRLEIRELEAKNNFSKQLESSFADIKQQIEQRESACVAEWKKIEEKKEALRLRELEIQRAEIDRDSDYAEKKAQLQEELAQERKDKLKALATELTQKREGAIKNLDEELIKKEQQYEASIQQKTDDLNAKERAYDKDKQVLMEDTERLERAKMRHNRRVEQLLEREGELENEVSLMLSKREKSFEREKMALSNEIERLQESIKPSLELLSHFEALQQKLGNENPSAILLKLKTYEENIKSLSEELATRPTKEMQEAFTRLELDKLNATQTSEKLLEENIRLQTLAQNAEKLEMEKIRLSDECASLKDRYNVLEISHSALRVELEHLKTPYMQNQERDQRIANITNPYITSLTHLEINLAYKDKELDLLKHISNSCAEHGLKFPRRILHAFHTSLKTAEWSPLTVLAGVSGTGKSELPKLYAHFGGFNFMNLPVQPNWDSQEAMLGFFNSITNTFDAQSVLRFLAQTQESKSDEYRYGLKKFMNIILLDEMNLAHVELYFAEFLSKLEQRRGCSDETVPSIDVKLGADVSPYSLPLGRNVLWAGTMNQDETTKSLSDKVLDRGTIINFPRPTIFERRNQPKALEPQKFLLTRELWDCWVCKKSSFDDAQILSFKTFIEEINASLGTVGRALGHRVWQSIEYYMANYPDVLEAQRQENDDMLKKAMKTAFEDQLVQKVMPKLRGIETRGSSKQNCLDVIQSKLEEDEYKMAQDFKFACNLGYGQFIWSSAMYLEDDEDLVEKQDSMEA